MAYLSEDYIASPIAKLAKYLRLSEAVAGATLLALANGLTDILTVVLASHKGNNDLAIGVLFGANMFLATIVLGGVVLVTRAKLIDGVERVLSVGTNYCGP